MSVFDPSLPVPSFIDRNPSQVTADMVAMYEGLTSKTLYPAQAERLLINVYSYRESLLREAIQDAAKLNLVRYSRRPVLDMLGENVDCHRILAQPAQCTLQFTFDAPGSAITLPAGTQVGSDVVFATAADAQVAATDTTATVQGLCTVAGTAANGFVAGQINGLIGTIAGLNITVANNATTTANGTDDEEDDNYRERIALAPESFSTTGPIGAYVYWARSADPSIVDVSVQYPALELVNNALRSANDVPPGCVYLYPLTRTGLPSQAIKDAVLASCSATNRRPLTDFVQVFDAEEVDYQIVAELILLDTADQSIALTQANSATATYVIAREGLLGLDIVREQIIGVLNGPSAYGVYKVNLIQPAADAVLTPQQWGHCTGIQITIAGSTDG
ncbi:phage tail protein [Burkholderia sp. Ac-20345]|uniref:baseplate assembly protein n=1 Tax=Burkholderia sp. Ac-20345 TaxID=2703891 RepID=UPI00197C2BCC|nr:baseplate J/gp47 family protein [Burkholderia sp. Ac-20345]MBN3779911.1 phage tail protein [Burkholderia sp. Ac-20345]